MNEKWSLRKTIKNAFIDYFMPIIILYRWAKAPEGAKTISIERPF